MGSEFEFTLFRTQRRRLTEGARRFQARRARFSRTHGARWFADNPDSNRGLTHVAAAPPLSVDAPGHLRLRRAGYAGGPPLFSLEDARGDDHGDGDLRYPLREDLEFGALDLLSFKAWPEQGGTRFEATFARNIPRPQYARGFCYGLQHVCGCRDGLWRQGQPRMTLDTG